MTLAAADKITKRFNDQVILERVSFTVKVNDRIGLVGKNGSGKTTLLEILADLQPLDSGVITKSRNCLVDYIEQEKQAYHDLTLFEYVASARRDLLDMRREIRRLEAILAESPGDQASLAQLGHLQDQYELENGFNFENEVKAILTGLGFGEDRYYERIRNFSGGEKNRAGLARALAGKGNLLLLDEPTNHLDIDSTCWLEEYLARTDRAYIVVSHDRTFLANTVEKVWGIGHGKIDIYSGSFEKYLTERAERIRVQEHHYRHQQEEIRRMEEFIRRNIAGQKTKQAQSRLKYLARIKRLPPPRSHGSTVAIKMTSSGRSYAHVVAVENVTVGYGNRPVVGNIAFDIYRGDKIGLIGANGSGKSTILKSLIGELAPMTGEIKLGNNVDVAYFDQELSDIDPERTVLENLWEVDPVADVGTIRAFLARFGFTDEDVFKRVSSLSGGEKTKLSLARLLYHPANFLIFDEPTNHLDLDSREALEEALIRYDGCCLIVSHDRYFLDRVVEKIFHTSGGELRVYDGNYSYFKEKTSAIVEETPAEEPKSKQAYLDFKKQSRKRARFKKELQAVRAKIAELEEELEALTLKIDYEIPKSDWEKLHETSNRKKELEEEIIRLYDKLEELQGTERD